jgi:hypothetical protein
LRELLPMIGPHTDFAIFEAFRWNKPDRQTDRQTDNIIKNLFSPT